MALTAEEREEIRQMLSEHENEMKRTFVTVEKCDETTKNINRKINSDFADLAVIKFQNKLILAILSAVGVAVLGLVVKQFWGL